jgi:hypothetical protein
MDIKGKKVKITYEAYNAVERCNVDFFDGEKWNHIFSMLDMGVQCVPSAYNIWDENKRNAYKSSCLYGERNRVFRWWLF